MYLQHYVDPRSNINDLSREPETEKSSCSDDCLSGKDGTGTNSTLSVEADGLDFRNKVQTMRVR